MRISSEEKGECLEIPNWIDRAGDQGAEYENVKEQGL
jgi:hypothetical protein